MSEINQTIDSVTYDAVSGDDYSRNGDESFPGSLPPRQDLRETQSGPASKDRLSLSSTHSRNCEQQWEIQYREIRDARVPETAKRREFRPESKRRC